MDWKKDVDSDQVKAYSDSITTNNVNVGTSKVSRGNIVGSAGEHSGDSSWLQEIKDAASGIVENVMETVSDLVDGDVGDLVDTVKETASSAVNTVKDTVSSAANTVVSTVKSYTNTGKDPKPAMQPKGQTIPIGGGSINVDPSGKPL